MKLPLTITQSGLTALIDAEAGTTNAVQITALALTASPFVTAPTLTALPGEFKRLTTISGNAVSEDILHFVANDDSEDTYAVTGIGLFLDSGELFGVFSLNAGDDALFEKASAATFLFAADITFEAGNATLIQFGDSNFLNPPATETTKGVAYLATAAEVAAGTDAEKIVTPATLAGAYIPADEKGVANGVATLDGTGKVPPSQLPAVDSIDTFTAASEAEMLALPAGPGDFCLRTDLTKTYILRAAPATTLANWAEFLSPGAPVRTVNGKIGDVVLVPGDVGAPPTARSIGVSGLAKGGGDLSANRTITVDIASAAEALAGIINDKAVTPASLASVLASLAGKVPTTRVIGTSGLATGGGDLTANRTINVPKATSADVEGLVDDTKALTAKALAGTLRSLGFNGYLRIPGTPVILQWGETTFVGGSNPKRNIFFPIAFPTACWHVFIQPYGDMDDGDEGDEAMFLSFRGNTFFTYQTLNNDTNTFNIGFIAVGF